MLTSAVRSFVLLSTLLVAGQAVAKDLAQMSFGASAGDAVFGRIAGTITVADDGAAKVVVTRYGEGEMPVVTETVRQLAPAVVETLSYKIQMLSNEELTVTTQDIVCMMMPLPGSNRDLYVARGFDYETGTYAGELELTLTQRGCWSHLHVAPTQDYAKDVAQQLAAQLEILGVTYAVE